MKRNNKNKFKTQNGIVIAAQQLIASKKETEREREREREGARAKFEVDQVTLG